MGAGGWSVIKETSRTSPERCAASSLLKRWTTGAVGDISEKFLPPALGLGRRRTEGGRVAI